MNRHEAFDRMKDTINDQLAASRAAREWAETQQMIAVLIVFGIVGAVALAAVLLA